MKLRILECICVSCVCSWIISNMESFTNLSTHDGDLFMVCGMDMDRSTLGCRASLATAIGDDKDGDDAVGCCCCCCCWMVDTDMWLVSRLVRTSFNWWLWFINEGRRGANSKFEIVCNWCCWCFDFGVRDCGYAKLSKWMDLHRTVASTWIGNGISTNRWMNSSLATTRIAEVPSPDGPNAGAQVQNAHNVFLLRLRQIKFLRYLRQGAGYHSHLVTEENATHGCNDRGFDNKGWYWDAIEPWFAFSYCASRWHFHGAAAAAAAIQHAVGTIAFSHER